MLRVRIAPLPDGLHAETFRPTAGDLDLDPEVFSDIEVDVRLDAGDSRVLAMYEARATAHLECDRTLDLYDQPVEGEHAVLFAATGGDDDDDDVRPLPDDATHVDLADSVRDTLVLALPLRRVSPAAEAAEIPQSFGGPSAGEPADDRWAALESLRQPDADTPDTD
ncbi:MAG: DUF177 domain-containing protein [Bacteroidota bacterium]